MSNLSINGVTLHYRTTGAGPETILFSHGYLMNHTMFDGQINSLQQQFRCVTFDHRGHGQSEVTESGYELDNLVTDAIALIEQLAIGPVHFVGMSTGGFVGLRIALRRPDLLNSLVLMDTSAAAENEQALKQYNLLMWVVHRIGWWAVGGRVMQVLFHDSFLKDATRRAEVKKWRNIIQGHDKQGVLRFGKGIFARDSVVDRLGEITLPTAVVIGTQDVATPMSYAQQMVDRIPNATLYTIPDAGHSAAVEKPHEVAAALQDFYESLGLLREISS